MQEIHTNATQSSIEDLLTTILTLRNMKEFTDDIIGQVDMDEEHHEKSILLAKSLSVVLRQFETTMGNSMDNPEWVLDESAASVMGRV